MLRVAAATHGRTQALFGLRRRQLAKGCVTGAARAAVVVTTVLLLAWARSHCGEAGRSLASADVAFLPPARGPGRRGPVPSVTPSSQSTADSGSKGRGGTVGRLAQAAPSSFQDIDSNYNPQWLDIEAQPIGSLDWSHAQTGFAAAATGLYVYDMWRIFQLSPPGLWEVAAAGIIYLGLYASRYQEVRKLDKHYQISFYASCGWTFYAFASLLHAFCYHRGEKLPLGMIEAFHGGACAIYLGSCFYFYSYHWGRAIRHFQEGRARPWFMVGLGSLTFAHGLTVGHIAKFLEDPGWFPTVAKIYDGQWQWIADTRLLELYLTAAALFLVILHLRGVLTGTANATIVFLGTVILPTAALVLETNYIDACSWQHYFMWGPKHW